MNWRQMMYVSQALVILLASNSREACAEDAKRVERSYSFFFSGSTFGKSCLFSLNVPVKAWMNAFRKTLKIVVMTAAFGLSKLPLNGALVPIDARLQFNELAKVLRWHPPGLTSAA